MNTFFSFEKFITPTIIKILFWIMLIFVIIAGIASIITGITSSYGGTAFVLLGIGYIIIGPIFVRVFTELLLLLFIMNDSLKEIKKNTDKEVLPE
jgi:hypothetical protein